MWNFSSKKLALLTFGILWLASDAQAGLLPISVNVTSEGSNSRYSYGVVLTSDSTLHAGDFFTAYDFAGFVRGTNTQPAGFTFSSADVGPTPGRLNPEDNPKVPNLTWTYNGPTTTLGQSTLGNFTALSVYSSTRDGFFTALTHRQIGGHLDSNITDTTVPVPTAPQCPEPATLILLAAGLPLLGAARYLKKKPSEK